MAEKKNNNQNQLPSYANATDGKPSYAKATDGKMDKIISLCKRRGFIFGASEIYGGLANSFDYGPLGSQMKKNIKDYWWSKFVIGRDDIVGLDSAIIQNPKAWEASGHLASFSDPLIECRNCHRRFREDHFKELLDKLQITNYKSQINSKFQIPNNVTREQAEMLFCTDKNPHDYTESKDFNLMFKTFIGVTEESSSVAYLRPETAQGIFLNFKNVIQSNRVKIPFGIAQVGKAFRNEITPGNFIFRTREFEQLEIEYFVEPSMEESEKYYRAWIQQVKDFYAEIGIKDENLTIREHDKDELSHYSSGTSDVEYKFPFGVSELGGIAQRTDYDLSQHEKFSGQELKYFEEATGKKYVPYVIEPSLGVDRAMLALLCDAYDESDGNNGRSAGEVTLRISPKIAPIKVGVFPLIKKEGLPEIAQDIAKQLKANGITTYYDESGSVGRRYRRLDEVGAPWCVTVDFDSKNDQTVTVRDRDTMKQERISISELSSHLQGKII